MIETKSRKLFKWIQQKITIQNLSILPTFNEGEVWWVAIGENVGIEINGKNERFSRPVLIIKKLSREGFLGIPLTSQKHGGSWYVSLVFKGKKSIVALSQIRTLSAHRLYNRIGTIPKNELIRIDEYLIKFYLEKKLSS